MGEERSPFGRAPRVLVVMVVMATTLAVWPAASAMLAPPAGAAVPVRETPLDSWEVKDLNATSTLPDWDVLVWDFAEINGVMYVGGRFTTVRRGAGFQQHNQAYLAAFDVATGEWIDTFRPTLDNGVYSLAVAPGGNRLLVGGEFSNVNGAPGTNSLAALDPVTGAVDPGFTASVTHETQQSTVMDIEVSGNDIYIGGIFTHVEGASPNSRFRRYRIARLDGNTGLVDTSFVTTVTGGRIFDMSVQPDGSRLHIGGFFGEINGAPDTKWFGSVDLPSGATTIAANPPLVPDASRWAFAVESTNDKVFVGTEAHRYHVFDAATMTEAAWSFSAGHGGDYQALHVDGDILYGGGHQHGWEQLRSVPNQPYHQVNWVGAYDSGTGALRPEWIPTLSARDGVWTLETDSTGKLWVGGDPMSSGKQALRGFAVFPLTSPDDDVNLARNRPATQSSSGPTGITWRSLTSEQRCPGGVGEASDAVDGKTAGGPWECSFSSTQRQAEPWWQVDLGSPGDVDRVRVWNMTQGNTTWEPELDDAHVFVSDSPFVGDTVAELMAEPGVWHEQIDGVIDIYEDVTPNRSGRYVRVALAGGNRRLRLAEVQVLDEDGDVAPDDELVALDAGWRYLDNGTAPSGWENPGFDDASWASGPAQLGFGDGDEATVTSAGQVTTWFRTTFDVDDPNAFGHVALGLIRDDGARVFLNGTEVVRSNLPGGPIDGSTPASTAVWGPDERDPQPHQAPAALLVAGENTLAVEIHNNWANGPDISMALRADGLAGAGDTTAPSAPEAPDAGAVDQSSAVIEWAPATDDNAVSGYEILRDGTVVGTTDDLSFTDIGLTPETVYRYTVTAVDPSGNVSAPSAPLDIMTGSDPGDPPEVLIEAGSSWRYLDTAAAPAGWEAAGFDDSGWAQGDAELGHGDGDETTVTAGGRITTYLRRTFSVADAAAVDSLVVDLLADDGVAVYLNGTEVLRDNLPGGPLTDTTLAIDPIWGAAERTFNSYVIDPSALVTGTNTLAIELHNTWTGGDASFDLALTGGENWVQPIQVVDDLLGPAPGALPDPVVAGDGGGPDRGVPDDNWGEGPDGDGDGAGGWAGDADGGWEPPTGPAGDGPAGGDNDYPWAEDPDTPISPTDQ